jgi:hypothetical protein
MLLEIWRKVLGTEAVGLNDNFFDLGGTSLQLIQVHATISSVMHSDLSVVDLFEYPRISGLAARLAPHGGTVAPGGSAAGHKPAGGLLTAEDRARRQQAALARARTNQRRVHHRE